MNAASIDGRAKPRGPVTCTRAFTARLGMALTLAGALLLMLLPPTAVLVLGWIVRLMRRETAIAMLIASGAGGRAAAVERLAESRALDTLAPFPGWWRGIWRTCKDGLAALAALTLSLAPVGGLLLLSWWAGWENSFNKGYEQAWVGPAMALAGIAVGIITLVHLPMAFAHLAAEGRLSAVFEFHSVRRLIGAVRWRYAGLVLLTVLLSAPLFLAQILPTFIEKITPQIIDADAATIEQIARRWHVTASVYALAILFFLRRAAARLYARAVVDLPAGTSAFADKVRATLALPAAQPCARPARSFMSLVVTSLVMSTAWFGFFAMLYIAQFANHAWWNWINHPLLGLPWVFRVL